MNPKKPAAKTQNRKPTGTPSSKPASAHLPADTRESLLVTARRVFAEKGYEGATVKDLAEGAGVNISLVSYHFGGKEGLYRTCIESFGVERAEASERLLRAPASRDEVALRLQLFAEDFVEFNVKNADACKVVQRAMDSMDAALSDVFKKVFIRIFYALHSFIKSAQKSGFVRADLESEITTALMFGSLMHMIRSRDFAKLLGKPSLDEPGYRARVINHWIKNHMHGNSHFADSGGTERELMNQSSVSTPHFSIRPIGLLVLILSILAAAGAFAQPATSSSASPSSPTPKSDSRESRRKAPVKANAPEPGQPSLTLNDYLNQVAQLHLGVRAANQTARAAHDESREATTIFAPALIANGTNTSEGRSNPLSPADHFATQGYSLGLSQATPIGLTGKLTYNYTAFSMTGIPSYSGGYGQLDLSQSLLRNFGGDEFKAQADLIETGALAKSHAQDYVSKSLMLEAEQYYWRLALAREMVAMQGDAVDRAQKISDWTNRRAKLQLVDRAESLQASTNLQARRLDLRTAQDDERAAAQAFNASRGSVSDQVSERLVDLVPELFARMNVPAAHGKRDDVLAAEFQARATAANALLAREKDKATLELFGSAILTDPAAVAPALAAIVPPTSRPASVIGVRLVAPLNIGALSTARQGYNAEAQAADWQYQRKAFEEDRDWRDLTAKLKESRDRFQLYVDLEQQQKEKLDYERDRQSRGRSTLQQVLIYETDYELAQLGRIRTLADLLTLNAQLKLYGVANESR